jgi:hypothetical protein
LEFYPLSDINKYSVRNHLPCTDCCIRPQIIKMDTVVFRAHRQVALISISRTTDKDQPRLMGQTVFVIPLIFLPEGRDATLMGLECCI